MRKFTLLIALLITVSAVFAQKSWVGFTAEEPRQAAVTIQNSDRAGLTLEINVPGMYLQELSENELTFQHISLTDGHSTKAVGRPELPMLNEVIGIPGNQKVSFNIVEMKTTKLEGYHIYPFQTPTTDNPGGHDKTFVMDQAFYAKNANFPAENVILDQPQIWRDVKLTNIHFTPFTYNPATQDLTVITHMVVEVVFEGMDETMSFVPKRELSPKFYNMYKSAIPNFKDLGYQMSYRDGTGIKYLVITNDEAVDAIQPLVDWKNQMGHRVEVKTLEAGFDSPQHFKTYITELYESDGLEYVLIVGDAYPNGGTGGGDNIVPMYWWAPGGDPSYSDSWYTCLNGPTDHFADIAIGRFVYDPNSLDELEMQIGKTMTHYLSPDVSDNWGENTILIAHKEQYPGKYTQCCNEIASFNYSVQTPVFEKAYGGEGYSNSQVVEFVNSTGVGIFNYRGHGSATQLWDWTNSGPSHFTAAEVSQFNNTNQLFVFFDVCCDNMDIVAHANDCLCESFMKHESGCVAVNGAIIPSYTIPNHDYDKEMYKAIFEENITNIGYITNYANITVLNAHGEIGKSNVRTYLWLGDASIEPWTKQAANLTVTHEGQLFLGLSEFTVTAIGSDGPAENAMVCVSNEDNSIYAVAYVDASGIATVDFGGPVQVDGDVTVTVTLHNYLPYQALIPVIPQDGPYVVNDSYEINDNAGGNGNGMMDYAESIQLALSVKNVGIVAAQNVMVTISSQDEYVTITDNQEDFGDIAANQVVTVADAFAFDVAEDIPDGHAVLFDVMASDGTDTWGSSMVITGHAPVLQMGDFVINDQTGNNNGKLDPGENATISVYVNNTGSADAFTVMSSIDANDGFLTINTTEPQSMGDIAAAGMGMATFEVYADMATPAGHSVAILFDTYAEHNIAGSDEFNVVIGQIPVVIIDLDENNNSGPVMQQVMEDMGITTDYTTSIPSELSLYSSAFVCLGIYSSNHTLSSAEGQALANFLNAGGMLYMEGGDTWYYDAATAVHSMFNINGIADNGGTVGTINGMPGTFTEGLSYNYSGENSWIDNIAPIGDAEMIFENQSPNFGLSVSYDGGSYKTIGASFEFGGLGDSDASKEELMDEYLEFFEVLTSGVTANFSASTTLLCEGEEVTYTDYSLGIITDWYWEFEGGTPATSTEQSPTVMYALGGTYDVSLTVTGEEGSNSMAKTDYIKTNPMPGAAGNVQGSTETCQGYVEVYTVNIIGNADNYNWVINPAEAGELNINDNEVTVNISDNYSGTATLKVCGANSCGEGGWSSDFTLNINTCVGIGEVNHDNRVAIYPNPNTGQFTLELEANDIVNLNILNTIGEVVYTKTNLAIDGKYIASIDLSNLAEGVYYLRLEGNTTNTFKKIVIAR